MNRIGVLGSAVVRQTLARGFQKQGYEVRIGSRTPGKLTEFSQATKIPAGTFPELAGWAEAAVLAVHGRGAEEAIRLAGADQLRGKIVIDTTNPLSDATPMDGVLQLFTGRDESLLERLQAAQPLTRFVKAFNSVGHARMVNPSFKGGKPTMFYCGNDTDAKAWVAEVVEQFGWEPADMGSAVAARAIEPLAVLWCIPGFRRNSWTHAFRGLWS